MSRIDGDTGLSVETETIELVGVVRCFRERSRSGGHPDFEMPYSAGHGHCIGNVAPELGEDGEDYSSDFLFAERHRTQSNFRIQTNLKLHSVAIRSITAVYD